MACSQLERLRRATRKWSFFEASMLLCLKIALINYITCHFSHCEECDSTEDWKSPPFALLSLFLSWKHDTATACHLSLLHHQQLGKWSIHLLLLCRASAVKSLRCFQKITSRQKIEMNSGPEILSCQACVSSGTRLNSTPELLPLSLLHIMKTSNEVHPCEWCTSTQMEVEICHLSCKLITVKFRCPNGTVVSKVLINSSL